MYQDQHLAFLKRYILRNKCSSLSYPSLNCYLGSWYEHYPLLLILPLSVIWPVTGSHMRAPSNSDFAFSGYLTYSSIVDDFLELMSREHRNQSIVYLSVLSLLLELRGMWRRVQKTWWVIIIDEAYYVILLLDLSTSKLRLHFLDYMTMS